MIPAATETDAGSAMVLLEARRRDVEDRYRDLLTERRLGLVALQLCEAREAELVLELRNLDWSLNAMMAVGR